MDYNLEKYIGKTFRVHDAELKILGLAFNQRDILVEARSIYGLVKRIHADYWLLPKLTREIKK